MLVYYMGIRFSKKSEVTYGQQEVKHSTSTIYAKHNYLSIFRDVILQYCGGPFSVDTFFGLNVFGIYHTLMNLAHILTDVHVSRFHL